MNQTRQQAFHAQLPGLRGWSKDGQSQLRKSDALTALPDAPLFRRRIVTALQSAIEQRRPMAIVTIQLGDASDWQHVSAAGDVRTVLATCAARLTRAMHGRAMLNRSAAFELTCGIAEIGGEAEFALQLRNLHSLLSEPITLDGRDVAVRPYIGVAICPFDGLTRESLTQRSAAAARSALEQASDVKYFGEANE